MILGVHITSTKIFDGDIKNYILHVFEILSNLKVTFYISPNLLFWVKKTQSTFSLGKIKNTTDNFQHK